MRESFEQNIKSYKDSIEASLEDLSKEGRRTSNKNEALEYGAYNAGTSIEAEKEIYRIQKSKIEKLKKFKQFLQTTRGGKLGFIHPEAKEKKKDIPLVSFDQERGFTVTDKAGVIKSITIGEIMTDYEWGLEYTLDSSVNVHDIRKYYFSRLKADLSDKLDNQIIISELAYENGDDYKKNAYQEISERNESGMEKQGLIAEKMVKGFLKKLSIDTDADFEIVDANVYQDVEQKVDFIIHRKSLPHARGASVSESDLRSDIGIQFTTAFEKASQKERQIKRSKKNLEDIDDLVLVVLPAYDASHLYKKWKENKTPGGPEKSWGKFTQETIFRGVMDKVLDKQEIDDFCQNNFR